MIDDCAQLLAASVFFSQVGDEPVNIFLVLTVNIFELVGIRYGHYSAIMQKKCNRYLSLIRRFRVREGCRHSPKNGIFFTKLYETVKYCQLGHTWGGGCVGRGGGGFLWSGSCAVGRGGGGMEVTTGAVAAAAGTAGGGTAMAAAAAAAAALTGTAAGG